MFKYLPVALIAALLSPGPVAAKKKPVEPTQGLISRGCVVVDGITHIPASFSSLGGIRAVVRNACDTAQDIVLGAAFFNARGVQMANDSASQTVAPRTVWPVFLHTPARYDAHTFTGPVKSARIITVTVVAAQPE